MRLARREAWCSQGPEGSPDTDVRLFPNSTLVRSWAEACAAPEKFIVFLLLREQPTTFSPVCTDEAQPWWPGRKSFNTARPVGPSRMWLLWLCAHLLQHWGSSQASLPFAVKPCLCRSSPLLPHLPAPEHPEATPPETLCGLALPPVSPALPYAYRMGLLDIPQHTKLFPSHQPLHLLFPVPGTLFLG